MHGFSMESERTLKGFCRGSVEILKRFCGGYAKATM